MSDLKDKVILVTGGTSGIGKACCELFAQQGAKVVAMSIQPDEGRQLVAGITAAGGECVFQLGDVTRENDVEAAVNTTVERFGRLDAVHSNAGILRNQKITELRIEDFHMIINVNLLGPALLAKYAVRVMQRQGKGVMCFTTSVAADIGFPSHAVYCASKAGLTAMIRSLATDHSPQGIRFVGVSPGTIDTPMLAASCAGWAKPKEEIYADVAQRIPVRRMGQPDDVAKAVAFLLSDDAGFINGSVIQLEGGTLCLPPW